MLREEAIEVLCDLRTRLKSMSDSEDGYDQVIYLIDESGPSIEALNIAIRQLEKVNGTEE
jgi:hypothetical protein